DRMWEQAQQAQDERRQYLLLEFAAHTRTPLSPSFRDAAASLVTSPIADLRRAALRLTARNADAKMLSALVNNRWTAHETEKVGTLESWDGSIALIEAAAQGLVDDSLILPRISASAFGKAALRLQDVTVGEIARRIDESICHAAELTDIAAPDIEMELERDHRDGRPRIRVDEKEQPTGGIEALQNLAKRQKLFKEIQDRNFAAYEKFRGGLTRANARVILDQFSPEEFAAIVKAAPDLAGKWYNQFLHLPQRQLPYLHNIIVLLAHALSASEPDKALRLFERVRGTSPIARILWANPDLDLAIVAAWSSARNRELDAYRRRRLDSARSDYDLSLEVLAALTNGRQAELSSYVQDRLRSDLPSDVARALMLVGFSDRSDAHSEILEKYAATEGIIGSAQRAAAYAYERNTWARQWFERMCRTEDAEEFWCCQVQFC
ncbi:MAG: hypothetical protein Q8M07_01140, partial [Prosthecobacter sp.]|nr:hypothetical protein [Prosthecobacter sp.]